MRLSAVELDAVAHDLEVRGRARLARLERLLSSGVLDPPEPPPEPRRRWWRPAPPRPSATARLTAELEQAQRRVSAIRITLDQLAAEVTGLEHERDGLARWRQGADPVSATRIDEITAGITDAIGWMTALARALEPLHEAGVDALRALDHALADRAAHAATADRDAALGPDPHPSVMRVRLAARDGHAVLVHTIDRLTEEVALRAPRHRGWAEAEAEVARKLRDG